MKYDITKNFEEAVYSFEDFKALSDKVAFDGNGTCTIIYGNDVPDTIRKKMNLIDSCGYIFRKSLKGGYVPRRMTMHPDTAANISRGSARYGSGAILREILGD